MENGFAFDLKYSCVPDLPTSDHGRLLIVSDAVPCSKKASAQRVSDVQKLDVRSLRLLLQRSSERQGSKPRSWSNTFPQYTHLAIIVACEPID